MNYEIIILILAIVFAAGFACLANIKDKDNKRFNIVAKVLSLVFLAVYLVRLFTVDAIFQYVNGFEESFFTRSTYNKLIVIRLITGISYVSVIVTPWFKKEHLKNIVSTIVPVAYLLNIFNFKINIYGFIGITEVFKFNVVQVQFAIECILGVAIGITYLVNKIKNLEFKHPLTQLWQYLVSVIILLPLAMPLGTMANIWGFNEHIAEDFNKYHVIMLISALAIFILLYFLLRKRDKEDKWYVMSMLSFIAFDNFFQWWNLPMTPTNLPLHLCHMGITLMVIVFITRSKSLFYFCFFVNTFGALTAMLSPDVNKFLIGAEGWHFWVEHIAVLVIPITCMVLQMFPRPKLKAFIASVAVYTGYYLLVLTFNAMWWDKGANYFFMNGDKIIDVAKSVFPKMIFGNVSDYFAGLLDNPVYLNIGSMQFRFYVAYWIELYFGYIVLILIEWLLYSALFKLADDHYNLHLIKKEKGIHMISINKIIKRKKKVEPMYPEDKDVVRISHFSKVYSGADKKSVDDFNLTIHGGEVYGFLGHNGAGKSTTIKSLVGIQTITEGTISVCGFDIDKQAVEAKLNIGYVSDNHAVYEKLTGREYINYVANLYLVPEKEREERFEKYVKMFNLQDAIDREIKGYSHGMKQKIVVIASLMHDPKVWVLDEPLTGLDPTSSFQIKECMRDHANRGNIVFFSSHVIEVVEKICDKICIIGHGKLIGEWDLHKLSEENITLEELYMKYVATQNLSIDFEGKQIKDASDIAK